MIIDKTILDELTERAKTSPRLRMNMDLRNSDSDGSQRMLNAIEPGTILPVHRHMNNSVTIVCIRGHFEELLYNDNGDLEQNINMVPGGTVINLPIGRWHSLKSLESGTVILEVQDGAWEPLQDKDIMELFMK